MMSLRQAVAALARVALSVVAAGVSWVARLARVRKLSGGASIGSRVLVP